MRPKHSLAVRWFHWLNFPLLAVMIWSGLLIYWAFDPYKVKVGGTTLIAFFPDGFYKALGVPFHLADGMSLHFAFMWLFALNGVLYVGYTIISGAWRELVPDRRTFKEAWLVTLHDLGLRREKPPQGKFNAAQRVAYSAIIVMGFGSLLTGLAIYKPITFPGITAVAGGYEAARFIHFALTIGYVLFFGVHIVQVIRAGWNNFRSAVTGWEVENVENVNDVKDENKAK